MFTDITGEAIFARDRFYITDELVSTRRLRLREPLVFDSELTYSNLHSDGGKGVLFGLHRMGCSFDGH